MTWTCCGTVRWVGCSVECGRPRRVARSCARSGSGTCGNSTRSLPGSSLAWRGASAYYTRDVIAAARRHDVRFSITARKNRAVTAAIAALPEDAWTTIRYPQAVFDEQLQQWVSDAEVAEVPFTAFASRRK